MDFIRRFLEQKISTATGAEVRFGGFSFSPLSGTVDVRELTIAPPLLAVRRIEAKIATARALKKEIVIKSLVIDGPVVNLVRRANGTLNLPAKPVGKSSTAAGGDEPSGKWELEAQKVLLVGGRIEFLDQTLDGYRASIEKLDGALSAAPGGFEFVATAGSLGRRDRPVELGDAQVHGRLPGVTDLADVGRGTLELTLKAGQMLTLDVRSQSIQSRDISVNLTASLVVEMLLNLLPAAVRLPLAVNSGTVRLDIAGTASPVDGVHLSKCAVEALDIRLRPH